MSRRGYTAVQRPGVRGGGRGAGRAGRVARVGRAGRAGRAGRTRMACLLALRHCKGYKQCRASEHGQSASGLRS
jgi:hypothetical protein